MQAWIPCHHEEILLVFFLFFFGDVAFRGGSMTVLVCVLCCAAITMCVWVVCNPEGTLCAERADIHGYSEKQQYCLWLV